MKTILSLLLASGLPLTACAANQSVDLELGVGVADMRKSGSLATAQLGLIWFPAGRFGVEGWFDRGENASFDVVPGPTTASEYTDWIDQMHGIGVRYRFFGNENRRLQPFARVGLARSSVRFKGVGVSVVFDDTQNSASAVFTRAEIEARDDSIYYGIGASYALNGDWRAYAQVLHVPVKVAHLNLGRTEALFGVQYAF